MFLDLESHSKMAFSINQEDPLPSLALMIWRGYPQNWVIPQKIQMGTQNILTTG